MFVSQPVRAVASVSQSPYPASQLFILHTELAQAPAPWLLLQVVPQAPQFAKLVLRSVSQPFRVELSVSQLPKFVLQLVIPHSPAEHTPTPLLLLQLVPQAPQFAKLVLMSVSQPGVVAPSQSRYPVLHDPITQAPRLHEVAACTKSLAQLWLHEPQFVPLLLKSVSQPFSAMLPSQFPHPDAQAYWQTPLLHPVAVVCAGALVAQL